MQKEIFLKPMTAEMYHAFLGNTRMTGTCTWIKRITAPMFTVKTR